MVDDIAFKKKSCSLIVARTVQFALLPAIAPHGKLRKLTVYATISNCSFLQIALIMMEDISLRR